MSKTETTQVDEAKSETAAKVLALHEAPPERLDPKLCDEHPQNPRVPGYEERVRELAGQIRLHGQTTSGLVRSRGKRYEVVLGHKRRRACQSLGIPFEAWVADFTDDEALAILLADKRSHDDPDAMLESDAIASWLGKPGWTVESVATAMGRPVRWVALRANLRTLTVKSRKSKDLKEWPLEWLEEWAKLSPSAQNDLLERTTYVRTKPQLDALLGNALHELRRAPWGLSDATLVPKAGPCTECPKTSASCPGLFDGQVDGASRGATCRDASCWDRKLLAHAKRQHEAAKAAGEKVLLVEGSGNTTERKDLPAWLQGETLTPYYDLVPAKKTDRGAVRALTVLGDGLGADQWVKPRGGNGTSGPRAKPEKKKPASASEVPHEERLAESREKVARQRSAWLLEALRSEVDRISEVPDLRVLVALGGMFGVEATEHPFEVPLERVVLALRARYEVSDAKGDARLWDGVQIALDHALTPPPGERDPSRCLAVARWLAAGPLAPSLPENCLKTLEGVMLAEIPDPKWWTARPTDGKKKARTHASAVADADEEREDAKAKAQTDGPLAFGEEKK